MKWLIPLLCVLTLVLLTEQIYIEDGNANSTNADYHVPDNISPITEQQPLPVEQAWLSKPEKEQPKVVDQPKVEKKPLYPTLSLGGKDYQLLGIFKRDKSPFILLKAPDTDLLELTEGDTISANILLHQIGTSDITLLKGDETIKFKLFERSDHGQ